MAILFFYTEIIINIHHLQFHHFEFLIKLMNKSQQTIRIFEKKYIFIETN